jgi:hypothetical protein
MNKFLLAAFVCLICCGVCQLVVNWDQDRRIKELEEAVSKLLYVSGVPE